MLALAPSSGSACAGTAIANAIAVAPKATPQNEPNRRKKNLFTICFPSHQIRVHMIDARAHRCDATPFLRLALNEASGRESDLAGAEERQRNRGRWRTVRCGGHRAHE